MTQLQENKILTHCPYCTGKLFKNVKKEHAQGVWECRACGGVFFMLNIREPNKDEQGRRV